MPRDWKVGEVAVVGLGSSGEAASLLLRRLGTAVYASDASEVADVRSRAEGLRAAGVDVDVGQHHLERIARSACVVVSPGVPPDAPPLVRAREAGVEIVSEVELGLSQLPNTRYIAITGTNGKTTVTALTAHLLAALGVDAVAAGNIGLAVCEVAMRPTPPAWMAVEMSSYQLHDTPSIAPSVGVLTNLAPDHLDRYPSVEAYYADKALLFRNATWGASWVVNADDLRSMAMVDGVPGTQLTFSAHGRLADAFFDRVHRGLVVRDHPLMPRQDLQLLGEHNVANALAAALAVTVALNLESSLDGMARLAAGLASFAPMPHRLAPVGEFGGRLWVNDSKATNVSSTQVALDAMDRPTVLMLGGIHKGEPYTSLIPSIAKRCRAVVAYGRAAETIVGDLAPHAKVVRVDGTFTDAVERARHLSHVGDAVLLSPACASQDMFKNYIERGNLFASLARGAAA